MDVYTDINPEAELLRLDALAAQHELDHWLAVQGLEKGNITLIAIKWRRAIVEAVLVARTAGLSLPEYISRCFVA